MKTKKFVSYYRVSTKRQEESGAGLQAQKFDIDKFLSSHFSDCEIVAEFTEIESGKKNNRPKLEEALRVCKRQGATLIIAKLDRLARNVFFVSRLIENKVDFVAVDNPHATKTMVQILAVFAEYERDMISQRIKDALAQKKSQGVQLGTTGKRRAEENKKKANQFAEKLKPVFQELEQEGITASHRIADELNKRNIPTAREGKWHAQTVLNLKKRIV